MRKRVQFTLLLLWTGIASASTAHYIRVDGGTSGQCTGLVDAPYTGGISTQWVGEGFPYTVGMRVVDPNNRIQEVTTGGISGTWTPSWSANGTTSDGSVTWTAQAMAPSGQACAVNHPFWLLDQGTWTWLTSPGDMVKFGDIGPYYIGNGPFKGLGDYWRHCKGMGADCILPPLPSNTTVLGVNAGACHDAAHTHLVNPTILSGINGVSGILSIQGSISPDVECIELTQPDTCSRAALGTNAIVSDSLEGGIATYHWNQVNYNPPLVTQRINVTGSSNAGGALNGMGLTVASNTFSSYSITGSQGLTASSVVFNWTLLAGDAPRVGQHNWGMTGNTNGGGAYNFFPGSATITAVTGVTSGTFTADLNSPASGSYSYQPESGASTNVGSGIFTVTGMPAGTSALSVDSGTVIPAGQCSTGVHNYAMHGLTIAAGTTQGPINATLQDVSAIGIGGQGFLGSHINLASTDVFSASDIYVIGNGLAGWDSDGGGCNADCEDVGTINMTNVSVEWNGCSAVEPYNNALPSTANSFDYCYDQSRFGYGDGFAFIASGDVNLNVASSTFRWNTQDGFDALHLTDDMVHSPRVSITNSWSEGNEGQQFKLGAGASASSIHNVSIGDCRVLGTASNFPLNPPGWNAGTSSGAGGTCRAAGDQWTFQMKDGATLYMEGNTSVGYGATMYDIACAGGATCTTGTVIVFKDNISMGYPDPIGGKLASGFYMGLPNPFLNPGSISTNNLWYSMYNGCPDPNIGTSTSSVCADPKFLSEADINHINPHLQASSPAIGAGVAIGGVTNDTPPLGAFAEPARAKRTP